MQGAFRTEEDAFAYVEGLKAHGLWPGVIKRSDGSYDITHQPQSWENASASHKTKLKGDG